ncbi:MAG: glycosyltransferase family 4 protein [Balneolales bacterium]
MKKIHKTFGLSEKKHIAFIGNDLTTLIRFRLDLIRSLVSPDRKIYVFVPYDSDNQVGIIRSVGAVPVNYQLNRTSMNPLQEVGLIKQYILLFRKYNIEVVFSYSVKPVIYGSFAARLAGITEIYSMLNGLGYLFTDDPNGGNSYKLRVLRILAAPLYKFSLGINKKVFFQNPDDRLEFINRKLVSESRSIRLFGSGVNLLQFTCSKPVESPIIFVATGRLLITKGFREYCKAAEYVKKIYPDSRFIWLGGHDENPASLSTREVSGWVEKGIIECPGAVDNVESWFKGSSVFVLPSYREGTPRSSLEAMAIGRAIITTNVPGCRETVEDGVNGYLVPVRDASALAERMTRFIKNTTLIGSMGKESRKIAEKYFDVERVNDVMMGEMGLRDKKIAKIA